MTTLSIPTPAWAEPLLQTGFRYYGAHGGRMGGKSHFKAEALVERMVIEPDLSAVCLREFQKSLKFSVKKLIENKISELGLDYYFEVQETCIKVRSGKGIIIFQGMQDHTADSIKSLEGFKIAWFEEAQNASKRSLDLLIPTIIRNDGAELWFTWNPAEENAPIEILLRGKNPVANSVIVEVNYSDNPFLSDALIAEIELERNRDVDKFAHIWLGQFIKHSNARVFKNWKVEEFETPKTVQLRFGGDWGFANDPTVLIRSWVEGRNLYIDYEAHQVGCEIDDTPLLFLTVPESEKWPIVADSARPETISYMRKHGFPKILAAIKGAGSIEDGVEFLKSFNITVHPRCVNTIDELTLYSYEVSKTEIDPLTNDYRILNTFKDKKNNVIDALRYSCEASRRIQAVTKEEPINVMPVMHHWGKR